MNIKQELRFTIKKHKNDKVEAFATNISLMAEESLKAIEKLETHNSMIVDRKYISSNDPEIRGIELNQVKVDLLKNIIILAKNDRVDIIYNNLKILEEYTDKNKALNKLIDELRELEG